MKNEDLLDKDNILEQKDFNFSEIYKFSKLNSKFIFIITTLSFILSAIHSLLVKPTWQGEFQIVLEATAPPFLNSLENLRALEQTSINKTEIEILKSPSVMGEVFNFYKNLSSKKNEDLSYKLWLQSRFSFSPIKKTNVLSVKYQDQEISNILPILNYVSTKYQNYPNNERNKSLTNVIDYLKVQVANKSLESEKSLLKLQKFSFENSIGEFDGMFPAGIDQKRTKTGDLMTSRYSNQFAKLEQAESELLNKSVYFKENSPEIIFLKKRIKQLKKSLKRPKEILIEYRTLSRKAQRDEFVLGNLENQLAQKEIERELKKIPYKLITKPTIDDIRVAPRRKQIVLFWTSFGFIGSLLITLWRASTSDLILSKSTFDKLIPFNFLKKIKINKKTKNVDSYFLDIIGKNCFQEKNKSYNLVVIDGDNNNYYSQFCSQISSSLDKENIFIKNDISKITNNDINYLMVSSFSTKASQITDLLEDLKLLNIEISGWFLIDNE